MYQYECLNVDRVLLHLYRSAQALNMKKHIIQKTPLIIDVTFIRSLFPYCQLDRSLVTVAHNFGITVYITQIGPICCIARISERSSIRFVVQTICITPEIDVSSVIGYRRISIHCIRSVRFGNVWAVVSRISSRYAGICVIISLNVSYTREVRDRDRLMSLSRADCRSWTLRCTRGKSRVRCVIVDGVIRPSSLSDTIFPNVQQLIECGVATYASGVRSTV